MFKESVCQMGRLIRCTHADEVRSNATCLVGDMGNYVPPKVRRCRVAVQEEHDRLFLLGTLCWLNIDVGHLCIEHFDALEGKGKVGRYFFFRHLR